MIIDLGPNLLFTELPLFPLVQPNQMSDGNILLFDITLQGAQLPDFGPYLEKNVTQAVNYLDKLKSAKEFVDVLNVYCFLGFSEPVFEVWFNRFCNLLNRHFTQDSNGKRPIKILVIRFLGFSYLDKEAKVRIIKLLEVLTQMFSAYTTYSQHFKNTAFDDYLIVVDSSDMDFGSAIVNPDYIGNP